VIKRGRGADTRWGLRRKRGNGEREENNGGRDESDEEEKNTESTEKWSRFKPALLSPSLKMA
jgi:hypothetical protein